MTVAKRAAKKRKRTTKKRTVAPREPDAQAVNHVYRWILKGASERDIVEAIAEQWPDAEARPLIAAAMRVLMESASPDPGLVEAWCFEAARDLYRRALECDDFGVALRALAFIKEHAASDV